METVNMETVEVIKSASVAGAPVRELKGLALSSFAVEDSELVVVGGSVADDSAKERTKVVRASVRALFLSLLEHCGKRMDEGHEGEQFYDLGTELRLRQMSAPADSPVRLASFFFLLNMALNEIKLLNRGDVFVLRLEADEIKQRIAVGVSPSPRWAMLAQAGKVRAMDLHRERMEKQKQAAAAHYANGEREDGTTGYNVRNPETEAARVSTGKVAKGGAQ